MTSIVSLAKVTDVTTAVRLNLTRLIFTLIFIAAGLILIHPVSAQEATQSPNKREKLQQRIEAKREKVENKVVSIKEKLATREAALKAKLLKFKDKRKAEIAERVNTNLNKINQKQTSQMLKHLDRMSAILDKMEARVNKGSPTSIIQTRAKIASATAAVKLQAEKDYTLTISSESKVKADAKALRDQLHADLQAVRRQVIDAKQSVANAIRTASRKETTSDQ